VGGRINRSPGPPIRFAGEVHSQQCVQRGTTLRFDWRDATTACAIVDNGRSLTSNDKIKSAGLPPSRFAQDTSEVSRRTCNSRRYGESAYRDRVRSCRCRRVGQSRRSHILSHALRRRSRGRGIRP